MKTPKSRLIVIRRWQLLALAVGFGVVAVTTLLWERTRDTVSADAMPAGERVIHMVTGEFSAKTEDGREIEAYRWDPGTIVVHRGENVKLVIYGVNGAHHPFLIEGLDIEGVVTKGKETVVRFHASREGIYRLICLAHPDAASNGPMIAYIVVD